MNIFEKPYDTLIDVVVDNLEFKKIERHVATKYGIDELQPNDRFAQDSLIKRFNKLQKNFLQDNKITSSVDDELEIRQIINAKMIKAVYYRDDKFLEGLMILKKDGKFFNLGRLRKR